MNEVFQELLRTICRYGILDYATLRLSAWLNYQETMKLIGVLLNSGYLVAVKRDATTCSTCPLGSVCGNLKGADSLYVYIPTDKLKKLCENGDLHLGVFNA